MSFGWTVEEKEKYFKKAERMIKKAKLQHMLEVDRSRFSIVRDETVKVYMQNVDRKGNQREWWRAKREIEGFKEETPHRDSYNRKIKSIFLRGYIEMTMGGKQK